MGTTNNINIDVHPKWNYLSSYFAPTSTNALGPDDLKLCDLMFVNYTKMLFNEILSIPDIIFYGGEKEFEQQLRKLPALSIHQNSVSFDAENYPIGAAQLLYTPVKCRIITQTQTYEDVVGVRLLPFKVTYTVKLWSTKIHERNKYIRHIASRFTHRMIDRYYNAFIQFYNGIDDKWYPYSIYIKMSSFQHPLQYNMSGDTDNRWRIMQAATFDVYYHAYEFEKPITYLIESVKYAIHELTNEAGENVYFVVDNDQFMTASELDSYLEQLLLTNEEEHVD